ncbi:sugar transferase [Nocardioides sp. Root190]|uniref:sugar transferase n=1 Tax=Nocardioides sp. Root190 TaxID=1736488 RepID=UPI0009E6EA34|nr:sugar transferase [Nocardioides sp. Root190]
MSVLPTWAPAARRRESAPKPRVARVERRLGRLLLLVDTVAATVAVVVAMLIPGGVERGAEALLFVPAWLGAVTAVGEYSQPGILAARTRRLAFVSIMLPTAVLAGTDVLGYPLSASTVLAVCVLAAILGMLARALVVASARHGFRVSDVTHRVVLAGSGPSLPLIRARLESERRHRFQVVGACVAGDAVWDPGDVVIGAGLDRCAEVVRGCGADAAVIAPDPAIPAADFRRLCWALEEVGIRIFVWTGLHDAPTGRTALDVTDDLAMLHLRAPRRLRPSFAVKRLFDRVAAVTALLLLSPLLVGLAVAVRLDSPGPAFFRQTRVGRDDSRFSIWKLRTMCFDAEARRSELVAQNEASGLLFKVHQDPRITRLGRWLRRTSLDELPQLINVALGQMSLVGPRPALPSEVDQYPPDVRHRLVVEPGITGLWQVSGRSDLPWNEAIRLDQEYVDNWSFLLDIRILLRTIHTVCLGRGAY